MRDADRDCGFGLRLGMVVVVFAMAPTAAFAYIDPGSGAYMVQALFALVGAAFFYLRHPIRTVKSAWRWAVGRLRPSTRTPESPYGDAILDVVNETKVAGASGEERS